MLVAALTLVIAACGGSDTSLEGQTWTLTNVGDSPAVATAIATLTFTSGELTGNSACNNFSGTYAVDGRSMTIQLGPATLRACTPDVNAQETAIFAALDATTQFGIAGTELRLLDDDRTVLARYTSEPG